MIHIIIYGACGAYGTCGSHNISIPSQKMPSHPLKHLRTSYFWTDSISPSPTAQSLTYSTTPKHINLRNTHSEGILACSGVHDFIPLSTSTCEIRTLAGLSVPGIWVKWALNELSIHTVWLHFLRQLSVQDTSPMAAVVAGCYYWVIWLPSCCYETLLWVAAVSCCCEMLWLLGVVAG
jgi:hypothetical protein